MSYLVKNNKKNIGNDNILTLKNIKTSTSNPDKFFEYEQGEVVDVVINKESKLYNINNDLYKIQVRLIHSQYNAEESELYIAIPLTNFNTTIPKIGDIVNCVWYENVDNINVLFYDNNNSTMNINNQLFKNSATGISKTNYKSKIETPDYLKIEVNFGDSIRYGESGFIEYVNSKDNSYILQNNRSKNSDKINLNEGNIITFNENVDIINAINNFKAKFEHNIDKNSMVLGTDSLLLQSRIYNINLDSAKNIGLNASKKISLNSNQEIILNSNKKVYIGNNASEKAILGDTLYSILKEILTEISSISVTTPDGVFPINNKFMFEKIKIRLKNILSKYLYIK